MIHSKLKYGIRGAATLKAEGGDAVGIAAAHSVRGSVAAPIVDIVISGAPNLTVAARA
jgi:hypothetical protein